MAEIKKEFGGGDEESVKVAELKKIEQGGRTMEELELGEMEYESIEEFFTSLKKEFGGGEEKSVKVAELRKLEQGGKTMEEFVQEFKRTTRGSRYEGRLLVEEFK